MKIKACCKPNPKGSIEGSCVLNAMLTMTKQIRDGAFVRLLGVEVAAGINLGCQLRTDINLFKVFTIVRTRPICSLGPSIPYLFGASKVPTLRQCCATRGVGQNRNKEAGERF